MLARVEAVRSLDAGRIQVGRISLGRVLKGEPSGAELRVVVVRDLPSLAPRLRNGEWLVAFLRPLHWNSSLRGALPPGVYFASASGRDGIVAGPDRGGAEEVAGVVDALAQASRAPESDPDARRSARRALVVAEIGARHPSLVEDGVRRLEALASPLEPAERTAIERALARADLGDALRARLIEAIAAAGLEELAPAVARASGGARVEAARWRALEALGAPPDPEALRARLGAADGGVRAAAAEALLRSADPKGREAALRLSREDPEAGVRARLLGAIGRRLGPAGLPVLEDAMAEDPAPAARQAAARAIFAIGGVAARAALGRAAFRGPPEEQRRAVAMLRALGAADGDPVLERIRREHPDPRVREIATSGLPWHPH